MPTNAIEIQGTLRQDGTLVLDQKPNLPPGPVKVTLEPVLDYKQTEIGQFFERLWAEQRAKGHAPRTREEMDAELEAARQEDEERMQELERIHEECEHHRQQQGQSDRP
ncbi:MAG: hypothetical protein JO112_17280 [Planctomycetes bacterium]|nr:hypothetical protein [Planctomycetota bacterium]